MTLSPSQRNELRDLIDIACESDSDSSALDRLESLLLADDDACRYYLDYASLHGALILSAEKKTDEVAGEWREEGRGERGERRVERGEWREVSKSRPNQQISNAALPVSIILDTSPAPLSSPTSPFYVAHPFMFSNLFAILVISLGVLGAWLYQVDIPQTIAHHDRPANALGKSVKSVDADHLEFVGRVTGMADVQWADVQTATVSGANVPLGRRYAVSSGLMEITYDTGAKVILQGPVTYQVESRAGGFLSIGKLTARLEKSAEGRGESKEKQSAISGQQPASAASVANQKSEILNHQSLASSPQPLAPNANPQSPIPNPSLSTVHYPLFTIKTPTATVTDLGTEFGVEVEASGACRTHVFQGKVAIHTTANHNRREIVLTENQSFRIEANGTTVSSPDNRTNTLAPMFARRMPGRIASDAVSLADLVAVAGGAFDSRLGGGLDPRNANMVPAWFDTEVKSSGKYERYLGQNPRIDGVFMPLGGDKPVQLDSIGHTFMFPKTCGRSFGTIWASNVSARGNLLVANGSARSVAGAKQVLLLHANAGITFDLLGIRAAAGRPLVRFQSLVVNRPPALHAPKLAADVWVFVDGRLRFSWAKLCSNDAPVPIDFSLSDGDRFLTLVSTDSGDESYFDDIQYIDPQLLLKATIEENNND